jgi:TolB-like protein/sugar lactone lactonase YvrE
MQSERWRTCTDIFHAALERAPDERPAFLEQSCAGDASLRQQVDLLLKYHDEAGQFMAAPASAQSPELLREDPDALIGQHLGAYRIDGVLGVGGMGVVYLAYDERLGRKVGLKLLPRAFVNDEGQLERLKLEARTASALNHPNIVTVHEIGVVESTHYIAIEFIEGVTLRERINRAPIPPDEAVEIVTQVASALCVAHRAGIVHRDIKPENIMIRPDGYVKVLDFGIAKSTDGDITANATATLSQSQTRTRLGLVLGTMRYMSPEQARGEVVDGRSDIWSLGVVLHEMLTGHPPFDGSNITDVKNAIIASEPEPLAQGSVPFAVQEIVGRCLHKDPAARFQSSEELLAELRVQAPHARRATIQKRLFAVAGAVILVAAVLFAIFAPRWRRHTTGKTAAPLAEIKPTGIAVDASGNIYVADFPNHSIRLVTPDGTMTDFAGFHGESGSNDGVGTAARFANPADVAFGPDHAIYVPDCDNHVIRKIAPDRTVSTFAGQVGQGGHQDGPAASAKFKYPTSVAVDRAGNVYVADIANHVVRKITPGGVVSTLAGAPGSPGSEDGVGASARFNQVHGLDVDRDGNVYAADFGNHTIRKITPDGVVTTIAGQAGVPGSNDGPGTVAHLCAPYSVATDIAGNVYVADTSNHTIRKIDAAGVVSTLAGLAGNVGNRDAPGELARFAIPASVEADANGNIYVADFGNHAIRKITADAVVSTVKIRTISPNETSRKSIAVLPFADLSPGANQQYFSDGIAEEILNALAHVKDLKVAGRSSSFSFRGKNQDLRTIGAALGVAHILEGSVRTQGDKVRITAQLIQVSDGFHLWSETYDGDLRDVFSLQERIARAITGQLQVVLQGEQKSQLVKTATSSTEAYALFLQATSIFNRRDGTRFPDAMAQLHEALRLDPKFARAHARLASLSSIAPGYDAPLTEDAGDIVTREARLAIELDPTLAEPHAAIGQMFFTKRRYSEAHAAYARALALDANDAIANFWLGTLLSSTGHARASAAVLDKVLATDPMLPNALLWRGWVHLQLGEVDEAERLIRRAADAGLTSVGLAFAHVAQARGDKAALVEWLARGLEPFMRDLPGEASRVIAVGTVGGPAERAQAIAIIEDYLATQPRVTSGAIPLALVWLGEPKHALAVAQERPTRNDTLFLPSLWTEAGRNARTLPEFSTFVRQSGLAEFWNRSQPADLCTKGEHDDYICQ